jgi:hypothetical protein
MTSLSGNRSKLTKWHINNKPELSKFNDIGIKRLKEYGIGKYGMIVGNSSQTTEKESMVDLLKNHLLLIRLNQCIKIALQEKYRFQDNNFNHQSFTKLKNSIYYD